MADFSELFKSTSEQIDPLNAVVEGEIPKWLNGTLLRLGPGKFDIGDDFVMNHWFDGYGVLISFRLKDGKVTFMKRFVQSDALKRATAVGKPVFTEYGTKANPDPGKTFFSRIKSALLPELTDSDSINIFKLEDSVYAATETNFIRRINPYTLETLEKVDLSKRVPITWASSHHYSDDTGTSWTVGTSISTTGVQYHVIKIPKAADGKADTALKKASVIASAYPTWKAGVCYYHSFAMSENYLIFVEQPMVLSTMKLVSATIKAKSLRECMDWHPDDLNRFIIVEKATGIVCPFKVYSSQPFFSLHCINAFEKDGHIVIDIVAHDSPEIVDKLFIEKLRKSEFSEKDPSSGRRYVIPSPPSMSTLPSTVNVVKLETTATAVKTEDIWHLTPEKLTVDEGYELPSVSPRQFGKFYRYYYASGMYDPGPFRNSLLKVDTVTKKVNVWKKDDYSYPGEAQFVARPDATDEDDGVLLVAVTDVREDHPDYLLILDAKTMTEVARAEVDSHVPNLIHSLFLPDGVNLRK